MVGPEAEHSGIIRAGRALRRGDGHGGGAQARAHRQPRVRRRLLRHGGAGVRSRLHPLLAHRPHGRDGGRVRGHGGARARDRARPARATRARPRGEGLGRLDARGLRGPARRPLRGRARACGRHRHARGDPRPARLRASHRRQLRRARTSARSCFRRSTRPPLARNRMRRRVCRAVLSSSSPALPAVAEAAGAANPGPGPIRRRRVGPAAAVPDSSSAASDREPHPIRSGGWRRRRRR